jgi:glucose/arabinose dehydrogenase
MKRPGWFRRIVSAYSGVGTVARSLVLLVAAAEAQPTLSDPNLQLTTVVTGLAFPTTMAFLGPNDFLVLEKNTGRVRRVLSGVLQAAPVLDVTVNNHWERGMLGIAINTEQPPRVFLFYTEASGTVDGSGAEVQGNRVYRYTWNPNTATLENPQLILDLPAGNTSIHAGGILALGPTPGPGGAAGEIVGDGSLLYAVIGDLNRDGQLQNNAAGAAPDDTGVILRVRQDGTAAPGNPFVPYCSVTTAQSCAIDADCPAGQECRTLVARYYAYGIRNSFGMAIDPVTGDLWDTENGENTYDEVNRVLPGFNSGWRPIMGPVTGDTEGTSDLFNMPGAGLTYSDPEFSWKSPPAVTAIVFPFGSALGTDYDGSALVGDYNFSSLYRFPLNAERTGFNLGGFAGLSDLVADSTEERNALRIGSGFNQITDLKVGPDGAVYVVSYGNGAVYRIVSNATPTPSPTPTPIPTSISGTVRYYAGNAPVPDVTVDLAGAAPASDVTAAAGGFGFDDLAAGNWTITPRRTGGLGDAVTSLDASYILQHETSPETLPFDTFQNLACDVTGDGTCTGLDAARILQLRVGLLERFAVADACGSDWVFAPVASAMAGQTLVPPQISPGNCQRGAIQFAPLAASVQDRDFAAVLFGDTTGNWAAAAPAGASAGSRGNAFRAHLGPALRASGRRMLVPLRVRAARKASMRAVEATLDYDAARVEIRRVRRGPGAEAVLLQYHADGRGRLRMAMAGARPMRSGASPVLLIDVRLREQKLDRPWINAFTAMIDDRAVPSEWVER